MFPNTIAYLIAALVAGNYLGKYVYGPRVLYRGRGLRTEPARTVAAEDDDRIHPPVRDALAAAEAALAVEGFGAPHRIVHGDPPVLTSIGSLLEHHRTGDLATIVSIATGGARPGLPRLTTTFTSEFARGPALVTTNSGPPIPWPDAANYDVVRFLDVSDAGELYALHRFRVDRHAASVPPRVATRGATEAERLRYTDLEAHAFHQRLCDIGYCVPVVGGVRLTIRGATLSAWRLMWPWRQWTVLGLRRRANAVRRARARAARSV